MKLIFAKYIIVDRPRSNDETKLLLSKPTNTFFKKNVAVVFTSISYHEYIGYRESSQRDWGTFNIKKL